MRFVADTAASTANGHRSADLLHDDGVNMRVEQQQKQRRQNDGGKVEEHQIVVVHHLHEQTGLSGTGARGTPSK